MSERPTGRGTRYRVDLGLVTFARATATRREGRLTSKREAPAELPGLGAPARPPRSSRPSRTSDGVATASPLPSAPPPPRRSGGPAIDGLVAAYT
ncbi:hypothetical protein [Streptomyces sp. NPDC058335]|uniref:hypothetical protein n=1 Tax=Streptomyces sp. NPDC058335 TaxID=3346451 RepID=UPI003648372B